MIKAIIFDFDGVIIESAGVKTEVFRKLFSKWPDKVDECIAYHCKNMGISRYVKFEYFFKNIIGEPYTKKIGDTLGKKFSELALKELKTVPFVRGAREFIHKYHSKYLFFIATGTPQKEIDYIVASRGIGKYFKGIFGTPATKSVIVENIINKYSFDRKDIVFVGDAESDRIAAHNTGVHFILRIDSENKSLVGSQIRIIYDLTGLKKCIDEIGK